MPCFRPLNGYLSKTTNPTGKRSIVWTPREADLALPTQQLPCGQCRYCRLEKSRDMAVRCQNEASLYENNCFITLTYDEQFLPENGSLDYDAPQLFVERLRRKFGEGIRTYGCAEYGEKLSRPHYHLCVFNHDFTDKTLWRSNADDHSQDLFISKSLQELWPYGHSTIGTLTFESAAYVARYVTKKITGKIANVHYNDKNPERSIVVSRRPGIGRDWFIKNKDFIIAHGFQISRGHKVAPPKFYLRLLEKEDPDSYERLKANRRKSGIQANQKLLDEDYRAMEDYNKRHDAWEHGSVTPTPRLYVLEDVQELKFQMLKRNLENG